MIEIGRIGIDFHHGLYKYLYIDITNEIVNNNIKPWE